MLSFLYIYSKLAMPNEIYDVDFPKRLGCGYQNFGHLFFVILIRNFAWRTFDVFRN